MDTWRTCLQSYLESLTVVGESHTLIRDHTTTLEKFFAQHDPASVSRDQVEQFCRSESYHGAPSSQTIKRRKAAIRAYFDHAANRGIFAGPNPARPPAKEVKPLFTNQDWQRCYESFLLDLKNKSGSSATVVSYSGILAHFFSMHPDPSAVSRQEISEYIYSPTYGKHRSGTTPATATINGRASCLRSFFNFSSAFTIATAAGPAALFRAANPTLGFRHGKPARAYKSLSMDEIKRFFECMSDPNDVFQARDRAVYFCYLLTCRRRSELAGLLWGQISYGVVTDQDGSMRQAHIFTFRNKGHQSELDQQELPEKCYHYIRHYLELTGRWDHMKPTDPVFLAMPNQFGGNGVSGKPRALTGSSIAKNLKRYCIQASIDPAKFSMHSLRHSGAYLRVLAGENLYSISRTLRHTSLDTTTHYLEFLSCNADRGGERVTNHLAKFGIQ